MPALEPGLSLVGTLDLEALQERLLAALGSATDAQGAAAWIADEKGELVLGGLRGLVDREVLPARLDPRSGALGAALLRGAPFEPAGFKQGEACVVPLVAGGEVVGMVLLERSSRGAFGAEQRAAVAELARFGAVAVRNGRRFRALEQVGLRHRETGTYDLGHFLDHAGKELYKARRYGRSFSLAIMALDDLDGLRQEAGQEASQAAARGLVSAVTRVVRDSDTLARVSDGEHHLLLPETDHFGALVFQRRVSEEIRREPSMSTLGERARRRLSMGTGSFPRDGDDLDSLLEACRARQEERRSSMLFQPSTAALDAMAVPFWQLADALLEGAPIPAGSPSARLPLDPELLDAVQREAARELGRDLSARRVLYVTRTGGGACPVTAALPRLETAARGDVRSRVYVLGPRAADPGHDEREHPLVTHVSVDGDRRFDMHFFLLFLSESAAYALLRGPDGRVFHTADAPLVDALVAKLQAQYDLHPL
jgi:diguanylate cyclase (GGDEF)-like protein